MVEDYKDHRKGKRDRRRKRDRDHEASGGRKRDRDHKASGGRKRDRDHKASGGRKRDRDHEASGGRKRDRDREASVGHKSGKSGDGRTENPWMMTRKKAFHLVTIVGLTVTLLGIIVTMVMGSRDCCPCPSCHVDSTKKKANHDHLRHDDPEDEDSFIVVLSLALVIAMITLMVANVLSVSVVMLYKGFTKLFQQFDKLHPTCSNEKSAGEQDSATDASCDEKSAGEQDSATDASCDEKSAGQQDGATDASCDEKSAGEQDGATHGSCNEKSAGKLLGDADEPSPAAASILAVTPEEADMTEHVVNPSVAGTTSPGFLPVCGALENSVCTKQKKKKKKWYRRLFPCFKKKSTNGCHESAAQ